MRIPALEPEKTYDGEKTTYYHGFGGLCNLEPILRDGALQAPGRQHQDPAETIEHRVYEDILRHNGGLPTGMADAEDVNDYLAEHEQDFYEDGDEYTQWVIEQGGLEEDAFPDFLQNIVWVAPEKTEASNHATAPPVPGTTEECGGYFKLTLPDEAVIHSATHFGYNGGVPGAIPLTYADTLHLENVRTSEAADIWLERTVNGYEFDIKD